MIAHSCIPNIEKSLAERAVRKTQGRVGVQTRDTFLWALCWENFGSLESRPTGGMSN